MKKFDRSVIKDLILKGYSNLEISREIGCSAMTVSIAKMQLGLSKPRLTEAQVEQIREMLKNKESTQAIVDKFDITPGSVSHYRKRFGFSTVSDYQEVRDLINSGLSVDEICDIIDKSASTFYRLSKKYNLPKPTRKNCRL